MMRTYAAARRNGATTGQWQDTPVPKPERQQLLVRVHAAGMNRGELLALRRRPADETGLTRLGMEVAGEIVDAGTSDFQPGERVMGRCKGGYSEYVLMDVHDAMPIPARLTWTEAAAIPITFMVVYDMLVAQGHLSPHEWVLITSVSSGVGVAALQLAKALGAHVIGSSRSAQKLATLRQHGLDVGIHVPGESLSDAVSKASHGHGADLIVNIVGGSVFAECVRALAFEGRLAMVGYVDGVLESPLDLAALHAKRLTLFGVSSKGYGPAQRQRIVQGVMRDVLPHFASGRISPLIDKTFPAQDIDDAIRYMESDAQMGKIVVQMQA